MKTYRDSALFELHFWLQVLGDHGRFLSESLPTKEKEFINQANYYTRFFDELLIRSKRNMTNEELERLVQEANQASSEIRKLKLTILEKLLLKEVTIALPPTFINHMVNEVEEFIRLLKYLLNK